ncbi:hypothetical protein PR003_g16509 [Phytophthora rubi]|uniref:Uncharacterized protein n=2 Tax=Phytophthora TaxID=4783 RepID=A0A6A4EP17_9STRA|nr:hypothetical protein PR003_g16509 [Phytophthora rubi]
MTAARRKGAECEGVACEHALGQQPLQLYAYLWSKASVDEDGTGKRVFSFVLTDTVVFKRQKPTKWFFTSKQERGKVLCRTKRFLSTTRVMQEFLVPRWAPNTLPKLDNDKQILATYAYLDRTSVYGEMCMAVEHLDKDGLENLLEDREMPSLSVLQRFIPTKSGYNHTIRSVYTVDGCSVQKCISPFLLSDEKVSMVKRTATFEVNDPLLRHRDVTDKEVLKTVEKINGEIAAHLEPIVGKEMVRFVNYFKIGADHRIYLLWSSMLSFDAGIKGAAKSYGLSVGSHVLGAAAVPSNVEDSDAVATNQSLIGCTAQLKVCPNCNQMLPRDQVEYVVTYRSIIRQFERDDVENNSEEDANSIPTLLRAISGPIQAERFKQLKQTATYLYQTVQLCLTCARNINAVPKDCSSPTPNNGDHINPGLEEPKEATTKCNLTTKGVEAVRDPKPVVVVHARASSAGSMSMKFSKKNLKNGSSQYRQHLLRVLPRLNAFDPPELPPRERLRQLARHLSQTFGHPSLRFALSQCNIFPVGSLVPMRTLTGVCNTDLLMSAARYWNELCQVQESSISPQTIDIDALDSLLAGSLKPLHRVVRPAELAPSRQKIIRPTRYMHITEASCPVIPRTPSSTVCAPKRPDRPHSCISTTTSSRRARLLSLTDIKRQASASNSKSDAANSNTRQTSFVQVVDGIKCLVRPTARPSSDDQCVLHLELTKIPSENNQAMEITLKITEIIALLGSTGNTQHLTNQAALLEGILPLLQIRDSQLHIPAFQQQQLEEQQGCQQQQQEQQHLVANDASLSTSSAESAKLLPRRPPSRAAGHRVQFQ